jgi:hypothetical protein
MISIFINYRTLYNFVFWLGCVLLHKQLSNYTYSKGMELQLQHQPPLYDIIQSNFHNLQTFRFIPEVLHVIPIIAVFSFIAHYKNANSVAALNSLFYNHGFLLIMRCIFFSVTLLPDSSQMCTISTHIGSCFDLIFSGHSTIMLLTTYIIKDNFYISNFVYFILHLNNIVTFVLIILCRNHYTIDVLISVCLTHLFYNCNKK